VLLLDGGGRLAYFGTPAGMVGYFRDACDELAISHPAVLAKTPLGADFVFDVLETPISAIGGGANSGAVRRFPPSFWQERFESIALLRSLQPGESGPSSRLGQQVSGRLPVPPKPARRLHAGIAIFATHFLRSLLSKLRNRGTIYSTCLEAPLLAALIAITLRSSPQGPYEFGSALHLPAYLFLSATVAMFLGLTNSATEVLRDRPVLRRERNCQPGAASYVAAKFVALGLVASAQCFTYLLVGNPLLEIHGMLFEHWLWMTLTAWAGTGMALVISSLVRTERAALTSVPLLLVPQMLLAGALVPYKEMNRGLFENVGINRERGGAPVPAMLMPLRYSYEAMIVAQATRNPFEIERIRLQRRVDRMRDNREQLDARTEERFELAKEGLRRLLAAGATTPEEAHALVSRVTRMARVGTRLEVETMVIWPEAEEDARPASEFFVNERIDLLVREAETFRNDYRNEGEHRNVFLALRKPLPFDPGEKPADSVSGADPAFSADANWGIETLRHCGIILMGIVIACGVASTLIITRQNRQTR